MSGQNKPPQWYRIILALRAHRRANRAAKTQDLCAWVGCNSSSLHRAIKQLQEQHGYAGHIKRLGKDVHTGEMRFWLASEPDGGPTNIGRRDQWYRVLNENSVSKFN